MKWEKNWREKNKSTISLALLSQSQTDVQFNDASRPLLIALPPLWLYQTKETNNSHNFFELLKTTWNYFIIIYLTIANTNRKNASFLFRWRIDEMMRQSFGQEKEYRKDYLLPKNKNIFAVRNFKPRFSNHDLRANERQRQRSRWHEHRYGRCLIINRCYFCHFYWIWLRCALAKWKKRQMVWHLDGRLSQRTTWFLRLFLTHSTINLMLVCSCLVWLLITNAWARVHAHLLTRWALFLLLFRRKPFADVYRHSYRVRIIRLASTARTLAKFNFFITSKSTEFDVFIIYTTMPSWCRRQRYF